MTCRNPEGVPGAYGGGAPVMVGSAVRNLALRTSAVCPSVVQRCFYARRQGRRAQRALTPRVMLSRATDGECRFRPAGGPFHAAARTVGVAPASGR